MIARQMEPRIIGSGPNRLDRSNKPDIILCKSVETASDHLLARIRHDATTNGLVVPYEVEAEAF